MQKVQTWYLISNGTHMCLMIQGRPLYLIILHHRSVAHCLYAACICMLGPPSSMSNEQHLRKSLSNGYTLGSFQIQQYTMKQITTWEFNEYPDWLSSPMLKYSVSIRPTYWHKLQQNIGSRGPWMCTETCKKNCCIVLDISWGFPYVCLSQPNLPIRSYG